MRYYHPLVVWCFVEWDRWIVARQTEQITLKPKLDRDSLHEKSNFLSDACWFFCVVVYVFVLFGWCCCFCFLFFVYVLFLLGIYLVLPIMFSISLINVMVC